MSADFEMFVRSLGLLPRTIAPDGRWRRCPTETHPKKRNGAYKLAPDGMIGFVQDWSTMASPTTWRAQDSASAVLPDYRVLRERNAAEESRRERAIQGARVFYIQCHPLIGGHPYLEAHGLDMTGCRGLRRDRDGWLVVPMVRGKGIQSLQRIDAEGAKRFWPGAPTAGASYTIERRGAPLTVLCEGLATGLALYAALPQARVVVAFTAGNLAPVARQLPRRGMAVVAADNDHGTEQRLGKNPGLRAAEEAAAVLGCEVAAPQGIQGTDWADFRQERTRSAVRPLYGARTMTEAQARRQVDAEIARELMRRARYLTASA